MPHELEDELDAVYRAGGDRYELDRLYDDWARDRDRDLCASGTPISP